MTLIFVLVQLAAAPTLAEEWFVADCSTFHRHGLDRDFQDAASYEKALGEAAPGSPLYLPKPFPGSDEEILTDLRWWYERAWSDTPERALPAKEQRLFRLLRSRGGTSEILRVANWTPYRCNEVKRRDFFFLIRVFDERHDEIARFSMSRYGLVTSYSVAPKPLLSKTEERWQGVVPALADIQEEIRQWFGVEARDPQYVWSLGPRLQCRRELPCVALRSQGETFLYQPRGEGRLFRFATAGPRVSLAERESLASGNGPAIQPPAGDPVADLVSIADQWVRVEEVSRPSAETP